MAICRNCQLASEKLKDSFTKLERIYLLSSAAAMARYIKETQDRMVSSSVVTKLLLSFDPQTRVALLQQLRMSVGLDITMKSCPHGLEVVS